MNENSKVTGIKRAVGDFNNWIGHAKIMYDTDTNAVWTDIFPSCTEWKEYHDEAVIILISKVSLQENWDTTTMREVKASLKDPHIIHQHKRNLYC